MRYLVTGGLGVVGSRIAHRLIDRGDEVEIIDSCDEPRNDWIHRGLKSDKVVSVRKERIERSDNLVALVQQADAVIHCAASTGIPYSVTAPADDWERNVDATRALLEALRRFPRPTAILSSVKPYRVQPGVLLTEDDALEPDEPYAASKAAQSMLAMAYARSYSIPVVTFRCSNLYGPAPCHGPRHGWLTWFCISAAIGRAIEVQGNGRQSRDMLHADDVFSACMAAIENSERLRGRIFNLGGGPDNRISVGAAAASLIGMSGAGEIRHAPPRAMDDDHVCVSYGAFLKETGWRPLVGVHEGMRSVFEWAKKNANDLSLLYEGA